MNSDGNHFSLVCHAVINGAFLPSIGVTQMYVKATVVAGQSWERIRCSATSVTDTTEVISQLAEVVPGDMTCTWNIPLTYTAQAASPCGWPQLCIAVCSIDSNIDTVLGYGWCHVPMSNGRHTCKIHLVRPRHPPPLLSWLGSVECEAPELRDYTWVCRGEFREVVFLETQHGHVNVTMDVLLRGTQYLGLD